MTTKNATAAKASSGTNGNGTPAQDPLAAAIAYEAEIAEMAKGIRGEETELTHSLYMELLPLLRKPIPAGFIKTVGVTDGKPYPSTGVSAVQVQMTRMDNVLTPLWWEITDVYEQDGKLCRATVFVQFADRKVPLSRASWGGMNRGSTSGNLYKGSFTNAAKRALAMVGPGQEVYLGATDYDPDVSEEAAADQAKAEGKEAPRKLTEDQAEKAAQAIADAGLTEALPHKLRSFGVKALTDLTYEQGFALKTWIEERTAAKEQA